MSAERVAIRPRQSVAELVPFARAQAKACADAILNREDPVVVALAIQDAFERLILAVEALAA